MYRLIDFCFGAFLSIGFLLLFLILVGAFVYLPAGIIAEKRCLEEGYPKYAVTYDLTSYCMNLEGTITVKVQELTND